MVGIRLPREFLRPPLSLPDISPTRGEIGSFSALLNPATLKIGETQAAGRSPPMWGRCPAAEGGDVGHHRLERTLPQAQPIAQIRQNSYRHRMPAPKLTRLSRQARFLENRRAGRRRRWRRRRQPLRRAQAPCDRRPLRSAAAGRRRAEELGGAEGAVAQPGRQAAGGRDRGPSARIYRLRGRHPRGRIWRRADDRLGHRRLGADGRRREEPVEPAPSSSGWPAKSSTAAGCWRG